MNLYYSSQYVTAGYAFDTTRKSRWIADSRMAAPVEGVAMVAPAPVGAADLELAHAPDYIDAVRTGRPRSLAESQGFSWDPGQWDAVCASTGGVRDAMTAAIRDGVAGSLSSGLHHARRGGGAGFCTFNGLALAALEATSEGRRVLVVDLDAHCGGGTYSLVFGDPRITQVDVSTSGFYSYRPAGAHTLDVVSNAAAYLPTVERRLEASPGADLVIYNAGMDAHEHGGGGIPGITAEVLAERERLVFAWARAAGMPIAFVLAGGYTSSRLDEAGLVDLHRLTIATAAATATDSFPIMPGG